MPATRTETVIIAGASSGVGVGLIARQRSPHDMKMKIKGLGGMAGVP